MTYELHYGENYIRFTADSDDEAIFHACRLLKDDSRLENARLLRVISSRLI